MAISREDCIHHNWSNVIEVNATTPRELIIHIIDKILKDGYIPNQTECFEIHLRTRALTTVEWTLLYNDYKDQGWTVWKNSNNTYTILTFE